MGIQLKGPFGGFSSGISKVKKIINPIREYVSAAGPGIAIINSSANL